MADEYGGRLIFFGKVRRRVLQLIWLPQFKAMHRENW
jgi:hypothetical protein